MNHYIFVKPGDKVHVMHELTASQYSYAVELFELPPDDSASDETSNCTIQKLNEIPISESQVCNFTVGNNPLTGERFTLIDGYAYCAERRDSSGIAIAQALDNGELEWHQP